MVDGLGRQVVSAERDARAPSNRADAVTATAGAVPEPVASVPGTSDGGSGGDLVGGRVRGDRRHHLGDWHEEADSSDCGHGHDGVGRYSHLSDGALDHDEDPHTHDNRGPYDDEHSGSYDDHGFPSHCAAGHCALDVGGAGNSGPCRHLTPDDCSTDRRGGSFVLSDR